MSSPKPLHAKRPAGRFLGPTHVGQSERRVVPYRHRVIQRDGKPRPLTLKHMRCMAAIKQHEPTPQSLIDEAKRINRHINCRRISSSVAKYDCRWISSVTAERAQSQVSCLESRA